MRPVPATAPTSGQQDDPVAAYLAKYKPQAAAAAPADTADPVASYLQKYGGDTGNVDLRGPAVPPKAPTAAAPIVMPPAVVMAEPPAAPVRVPPVTVIATRPQVPPVVAPSDATRLIPTPNPHAIKLTGIGKKASDIFQSMADNPVTTATAIPLAPIASAFQFGRYTGQDINTALGTKGESATDALDLAPVSHREGGIAAAQLAAMGLAAPVRVATGYGTALGLSKLGASDVVAGGIGGTVGAAAEGAAVGAAYDPEHPVRGAMVGGTLGVLGNEVGAAAARRARGPAPAPEAAAPTRRLTGRVEPPKARVVDEPGPKGPEEPDVTFQDNPIPADAPPDVRKYLEQYGAKPSAPATAASTPTTAPTTEPVTPPVTAAGGTAPGAAPKPTLRRRMAEAIDPDLVEERRAAEEHARQLEENRRSLQRQLETDKLTGLGNREALDKALPTAEADPQMGVAAFDANNFGKVNKLAGHDVGDQYIKDIAGSLQKAADEQGGAQLFRRGTGGDEFVVIAPHETLPAIVQRAQDLFGERQVGEGDGKVTVSLSGTHGNTFKEADDQLQAAKNARKAEQAARQTAPAVAPPATPAPAPASEGVAAPAAPAQAEAPAKDEAPAKYDYSSTQVELPEEHAAAVREMAARIRDEHLAPDGRENAPHITVKYGLHGNEPEKVRALLADEPPIKVTLGKTSIFPDSGSGDVVKADVDSPDLHRLNKKIADALPHTDTNPDYTPHATIAYVKKGLGKQYAGDDALAGRTMTLDHVTFSGKDGKQVSIPLGGKSTLAEPPSKPSTAKKLVKPDVPARPETDEAFRDIIQRPVEDIRRMADDATAAEETLEVSIFGEAGAKRYKALQARANSTIRSHAETNAASDEIARMEDALTDEQRNRLYGIGQPGFNAEELRAAARAAEPVDHFDTPHLELTLAREMTTGEPHRNLESALRLREAMRALQRRFPTKSPEQILADAVRTRGAAGYFSSPDQAGELVKATLARLRDAGFATAAGAREASPATGSLVTADADVTRHARRLAPPRKVPASFDEVHVLKNADGTPLTVYHGTRAQFTTFKVGTAEGWGKGIYFTDNRQQAAEEFGHGGRVIAAHVSMQRPFNGDGIPSGFEQTAAWRAVSAKWHGDVQDAWQEDSRFVGDALRELGYDGIIADRSNNIEGREIVVFRPEQVRMVEDPQNFQNPAGSAEPSDRILPTGETTPTTEVPDASATRSVRPGVSGQPEGASPAGVRAGGAGGDVGAGRASGAGPSGSAGTGRVRPAPEGPSESEGLQRPGAAPDESGVAGEGAGDGRRGGEATEPARTDTAERERPAAHERPEAARVERTRQHAPAHQNYALTPATAASLLEGGAVTKAKANVEAIRLLKAIEAAGRPATLAEQDILSRYTGWGGMPQAFDPTHKGHASMQGPALRELLTDEEWNAARASTPNAHYTSPEVIAATHQLLARLGFTGGRILEPSMGAGYFLGMTPEGVRSAFHWTGVELDSVTGRIAKLLYPVADVHVQGFQDLERPDGFFDAAVGNVPFGNYKVHDPRYNALKLSIHNYFFRKSLDLVRPGGVVAYITSAFTMDAQSAVVRKELAKHADLIGAIRLPGDAFKGIANTDVTTDLLVLRVRAPGAAPAGEAWTRTVPTEVPGKNGPTSIQLNEYFAAHPEHILGELRGDGTMNARFGDAAEMRVKSTGPLAPQLQAAVARFPAGAYQPAEVTSPASKALTDLPVATAPDTVRDYGLTVTKDGTIRQRRNGVLVDAGVPKSAVERVSKLIALRDLTKTALNAQIEDRPEAEIERTRKALDKAYTAFVKQYGPILKETRLETRRLHPTTGEPIVQVRTPNLQHFTDGEKALVLALEHYDPETGTAEKGDILTKRVYEPRKAVTSVATPADALPVVLAETGRVDLARIAQLSGVAPEDATQALRGLIFEDPAAPHTWRHVDEYTSGDVKTKLAELAPKAKADPARWGENLKALEAAIPEDLPPSKISVRLGAPWVPTSDVAQFVKDLLADGGYGAATVTYTPAGNIGWRVEADWRVRNTVQATTEFGTRDLNAVDLIEAALNLKTPTVYDPPDRDGKRAKNAEKTLAAQEKLQRIHDRFERWVWEDGARADRLAKLYNDRFNRIRNARYDGSHLTLPGSAAYVKGRPFQLRPHQKDAIWRIITSGNTLLAHVVGSGKTFTMIAAGMEQKRLGLVRKPLYVVPNHMLDQFSSEFKQLYPAADLLLATKDDFAKEERQAFVARAATNNWDAIIMTHRSFESVPMSEAFQREYIQRQLDELESAIRAAKAAKQERALIKQIEKAKFNLGAKLAKLMAEEKKDQLLSFEQMGVDQTFVDEADLFKNLMFTTKLEGVSAPASERAFDLYLKSMHLEQVNPGRGLVFATGTPIANAVAEMFTMQRYLQPGMLAQRGLSNFDAWAATFGKTVTGLELKPDNSGFRLKTRFASYDNVGELAQMFRAVTDVQTAEDLNLPRPKLKGGQAEIVKAPASGPLRTYLKVLMKRGEAVQQRKVQPEVDNWLKITGDGRRAALDMRLVDADALDLPDSKVNQAVDRIHQIWDASRDLKGAQLVFSDLSTPGSDPGPQGGVPGFNVYDDIKAKLVAKGVPAKEVRFIHDAKTDEAKKKLFADVRAGRVRVLLGSTEKMGAGTNVQDRLVALHDLDAPWRPRDIEQRHGRILRQGNVLYDSGKIPHVQILTYVTEGSFDGYIWQSLERKAAFIRDALTADASTRTIEDVGEVEIDWATAKAIASGNPMVKEKAEVDAKVARLDRLERAHRDEQFEVRREMQTLPSKIESVERELAKTEADVKAIVPTAGDQFTMVINGATLTKRADAGPALQAAVQKAAAQAQEIERGTERETPLGPFAGLKLSIVARRVHLSNVPELYFRLHGKGDHYRDIGENDSPASLVAQAEAMPNAMVKYGEQLSAQLTSAQKRLATMRERGDQPFSHAAELEQLRAKQKDLDAALSASSSVEAASDEQLATMLKEAEAQGHTTAAGLVRDTIARRARGEAQAQTPDDEGEPGAEGMDAMFSPAAAGTPLGGATARARGTPRATEAEEARQVKSLAEIARALAEMVDVPLRQGRFLAKARKAAGAFFGQKEVARVLRFDRLDTVAHEIGHYLSQTYLKQPTRLGAARRGAPPMPPRVRKELVALGKALYGTRTPEGGYGEEGIAEWAKFYVTDPAKLDRDAATAADWIEREMLDKEPALKAAMDQARRDFAEYQAAPATARVDAMIDVNPAHRFLPDPRRLMTLYIDDLAEIRRAVEEIGSAVNPAKNAYILSRLTRGGAGLAEEMVERGVIDPDTGKRVTKGVAEVLAKVGKADVQAFRRYLVAERTLEVAARGIDTGISVADAQEVVDRYEAKFRPLAEDLWTISNALIDYREAKGLLTPDEATQIKDKNQRRVGFYRVFAEDETAAARGAGRGFGRNSSGVQAMKGSSRKIIDPLESMVTDIYRTVQQAHAAEVLSAMVKHAATTQGGGRVIEVLTEVPKRAVRIQVEQVKAQLEELGFDAPNGGLDEMDGVLMGFENLTQAGPKEQKDLVRPVVIDGKRKWIQIVDAPLYNALTGLGTPQLTAVMRMLSIPTRTLRAGATLTLEFIGRNPIKDAFTAAVYSRAGTRPPGWDLARGLFHVLKADHLYQDWRLDGADNAAMLGLDRVDVRAHVKKLMRSSPEVARDWVLHPLDTLRMLSSLFENATRVGEYAGVRESLTKKGMATADARKAAALASRDVTIDFARAGEHVRVINQLIAFFNANVQGWDKLQREMRQNPQSVIPRLLAFITIPSLLLYLMQKDDPAYQEVPRWQKIMAWVIVQRNHQTGDVEHIWRIPKPPDLGVLFGSMPELMAQYVAEHDPKALNGLLEALSTMNPIHTPNALAPLMEWWANKSFFTDHAIVPEGATKLPAAEQSTTRTGELARTVGGALHLSPAKLENTAKGYAGGLATYGLDIGNAIVRSARRLLGAPALPRPQQSQGDMPARIPLLKGFAVRVPTMDAQSIQDALDAFGNADAHRQAWRRMLETGDARAKGYFRQHEAAIRSVASAADHLGGVGVLKDAHDLIVDAQRIAKDADPETRAWAADASMRAARAALQGEKVSREERRELHRDAARAALMGRRRLRRGMRDAKAASQ